MRNLVEKAIDQIKDQIKKLEEQIVSLRDRNFDNQSGAIRLLEDHKADLFRELKTYEDML